MPLVWILFIVIIVKLIKDFRKNPAGTLLNPLFFLTLYSALYFLLPLFYIEYVLEVTNFPFQLHKTECMAWSLWYTGVFYLCYLKSSPMDFKLLDTGPSRYTYMYSKWVYWIISCVVILIIIIYVPSVLAVRDDRGAALSLYEAFNSRFRLRILMYCHYCVMFIMYWKHRKLKYFWPCLLYCIIDYSHGGRTVTLMSFTYFYIFLVHKTKKTYLLVASCAVLAMILSGVFQRSSVSEFIWGLYMAGAEFTSTYLTTVYMVDHPEYHIDGFNYFFVALSKVLPGGMVDKMLGFGEWYGNPLSDKIGLGYGLAGNLITEALVYGGKLFGIISPILMGLFCLLLNRIKRRDTLFVFLYTLLLTITIQNIVRSYFWGFCLYPIQILAYYLVFLYSDYRKKILA